MDMDFSFNGMKLFVDRQQQNWRAPGPIQTRFFGTPSNWNFSKKSTHYENQDFNIFRNIRNNMCALQQQKCNARNLNSFGAKDNKFKSNISSKVDFYPAFEGISNLVQEFVDRFNHVAIQEMKTEQMNIESAILDNYYEMDSRKRSEALDSSRQETDMTKPALEMEVPMSTENSERVELQSIRSVLPCSEIKNSLNDLSSLTPKEKLEPATEVRVPCEISSTNILSSTLTPMVELEIISSVVPPCEVNCSNNLDPQVIEEPPKPESAVLPPVYQPSDTPIERTQCNFTEKHLYKSNEISPVSIMKIPVKIPSVIRDKESVGYKKKSKKRKRKHGHKKHKKFSTKTNKHKTKQSMLSDILEDYCYDYSDDNNFNQTPEASPGYTIHTCNYEVPVGCSSKISQGIEKCINFIASLPPVKILKSKPSVGTCSWKKDFSFLPDQCTTQINIPESLDKNSFNDTITSNARRNRIPSECETEDSFVCFENPDTTTTSKVTSVEPRQNSISESDDGFVICFGGVSQSPQECFMIDDLEVETQRGKCSRQRLPSECESDDFVITFEDNKSETEEDSQCDSDSESTFSDSSYFSDSDISENEEKQCAVERCWSKVRAGDTVCDVLDGCTNARCTTETCDEGVPDKSPKKKVTFNLKPKVHTMNVWSFAYQQARKGPWEQVGRDRIRFKTRIDCARRILEPVFEEKHRHKVFQERFECLV